MKTKGETQSSTPARHGKARSQKTKRRMPSFRRILVPLDFSSRSCHALDFAVPLAAQSGGKVLLIHVVEPVFTAAPIPAEMGTAVISACPSTDLCKKRLLDLARKLVPADLRGRTMVRSGRAHREIVAAAAELEADLIAMTTHGHSGFKDALLGNNAEHVVRHAQCPVLTVRQS